MNHNFIWSHERVNAFYLGTWTFSVWSLAFFSCVGDSTLLLAVLFEYLRSIAAPLPCPAADSFLSESRALPLFVRHDPSSRLCAGGAGCEPWPDSHTPAHPCKNLRAGTQASFSAMEPRLPGHSLWHRLVLLCGAKCALLGAGLSLPEPCKERPALEAFGPNELCNPFVFLRPDTVPCQAGRPSGLTMAHQRIVNRGPCIIL